MSRHVLLRRARSSSRWRCNTSRSSGGSTAVRQHRHRHNQGVGGWRALDSTPWRSGSCGLWLLLRWRRGRVSGKLLALSRLDPNLRGVGSQLNEAKEQTPREASELRARPAGNTDDIDAVAVAARVWEIVSEVSTVGAHGLAVRQNADVGGDHLGVAKRRPAMRDAL